jgi:maltose alpha-D-glucosyltransferase/alpha-amylase
VRALPAEPRWLDPGRLTAEERSEAFAAFAPDAGMQLYGRGIRRRLAPMLGDRKRIELAYSLLFSLPGTPVIRYGDEIGMGEDLKLKERAAIRTPMQWSPERNAGFSTADRLVRPVLGRGPYGYRHVNVEAQRRDPDSLLHWLTRMIRLRKECPEVAWGDWSILATRSRHVLALLHGWRGTSLLCVHNLDDRPHEVSLTVPDERGRILANLIETDESVADEGTAHRLVLEPYGYRWYRVGGFDYALRREP